MANKSERIQTRSETVASETNNLLRSTEDLASELLRVNSNIEAQTARRDALIKVITDREGWGAIVKTIGGQCIQVGALDSRIDMDALRKLGLYDAVYDAGINKAKADYDKAIAGLNVSVTVSLATPYIPSEYKDAVIVRDALSRKRKGIYKVDE